MSRIILTCSLAALLMGGGCANAIKNANQTDWGQARLACANVGIDPVEWHLQIGQLLRSIVIRHDEWD